MSTERHLANGEIRPRIDGEQWDTVGNGLTSQEIARLIPGLSIDPFSIRGTYVLTQDEVFQPKEINSRRIAARKRRQRLEREKAGLFADEVAAQQKDAREELEEFNARLVKRVTAADSNARECWMKNFRRLAGRPPEEQAKFVAAWNAAETPKDHAYFGDWLNKAEASGLAEKLIDRSTIADADVRSKVERMDKTGRTLKDIQRAARPDSPLNIAGQRLDEERAKYQTLGVEPPAYVSGKPSWGELQAQAQRQRAAKEIELRAEQERAKKLLLFDAEELKQAIEPVIL